MLFQSLQLLSDDDIGRLADDFAKWLTISDDDIGRLADPGKLLTALQFWYACLIYLSISINI